MAVVVLRNVAGRESVLREEAVRPPRWIIPLEPGQTTKDGPALIVEIEVDRTRPDPFRVHVWQRGRMNGALPPVASIVACQLGQALQDASRWCGQQRARMEASR